MQVLRQIKIKVKMKINIPLPAYDLFFNQRATLEGF